MDMLRTVYRRGKVEQVYITSVDKYHA